MNNKFLKFTLGFLFIIALGIGVLFLVGKNDNTAELYDKQLQMAQEMEDKYREDIYGGDTPEETLQLFIDALKAGDIDLASKYFVIDKQEEKLEELRDGEKSGGIELLLDILAKEKFGKELFEGRYKFTTYEGDRAEFSFDLIFNSLNFSCKLLISSTRSLCIFNLVSIS